MSSVSSWRVEQATDHLWNWDLLRCPCILALDEEHWASPQISICWQRRYKILHDEGFIRKWNGWSSLRYLRRAWNLSWEKMLACKGSIPLEHCWQTFRRNFTWFAGNWFSGWDGKCNHCCEETVCVQEKEIGEKGWMYRQVPQVKKWSDRSAFDIQLWTACSNKWQSWMTFFYLWSEVLCIFCILFAHPPPPHQPPVPLELAPNPQPEKGWMHRPVPQLKKWSDCTAFDIQLWTACRNTNTFLVLWIFFTGGSDLGSENTLGSF